MGKVYLTGVSTAFKAVTLESMNDPYAFLINTLVACINSSATTFAYFF